MIVTLANYLKVKVTSQDIRKVKFVNTTRNSYLVQVSFYSPAHGLQLLDSKRILGKINNSNAFNYSLSNSQIFINESLPQDIHKLLIAAKQARQNYGFYKVWHKNGRVLTRLTIKTER